MGKEEIVGGIFRGMVTGGSWVRLAMWTKNAPQRELSVRLSYTGSMANWELILTEHKNVVFQGVSSTLEGVTVQAVAALGKSL